MESDGFTVSVIIPMHNAADTIGVQLSALSQQDFSGAWEIIVVDNLSTDESVQAVQAWKERLPQLSLVTAAARQGAAHARNVGTVAAKGDILAYCDADDAVVPGWLSAMVRGLDRSDMVGSVFDVDTLPKLGLKVDDLSSVTANPRPPGAGRFLPWAGGAGIAMRRSLLDILGPWREDLRIGEDVELCWRAQLAGYTLEFPADSIVLYRPPRTLWRAIGREFWAGFYAPALYRQFRSKGAVRNSIVHVLRAWIYIVIKAPLAVVGKTNRRDWLCWAAGNAGRIVGSIRHRTVYL